MYSIFLAFKIFLNCRLCIFAKIYKSIFAKIYQSIFRMTTVINRIITSDSGYLQRPWLMTPILNAADGTPSYKYNAVQGNTSDN